jgi:signal transduction histidine kinase
MTMPPAGRRWTLVAAVVGGWLALGLLSTSLTLFGWRAEGIPIGYWRAALLLVPYWLYWALITPAIAGLARAWPLTRRTWPSALPVHLVAALASAVIHVALAAALYKAFFTWPPDQAGGPPFLRMAGEMLRSRWQFEVMAYGGILLGVLALRYAREAERQAVTSAMLQTELAQAQLAALRMQLNPHFLFNTLQAVSVLATEDPPRAQRMLALLGDLLRQVLDDRGRQEVTLREELELLARYLEIEKTRFPDRLDVRFEVAPDAECLLVPTFVLQPLVENAIRHGIAPRASAGTVTIGARRVDGRLEAWVSDDGPGSSEPLREGVGLATTRARLEKLYGSSGQRLSIRAREGGGLVATIEIPVRQGVGDRA